MVATRISFVLSLLFFSALPVSAAVEATVVNKPVWKGYALDWCLTWSEGCGKPAADKYCQSGGYDKSSEFVFWENLGKPTRLIGSNQVCDDAALCDSFKSITCIKTSAPPEPVDDEDEESESVTYNKPKVGSRRLDWCLTWATGCGKPAADYFCKKKGHDEATAFKIAEDIGKTRIMKTGQKCSEPMCDGFKFITCE
jgi:hypothetical protein